jgi:hypothetical protein
VGRELAAGRGDRLLLGDALLEDWRRRTRKGTARLRAYYDVHPAKHSALTLDPARRNRFGDPLPLIEHHVDEATKAREAATAPPARDLRAPGRRWRPAPERGRGRLPRPPGGRLPHGHGPTRACATATGAPTTTRTSGWGLTHPSTGGLHERHLTFAALTLRSADRIAQGVVA